MRETGGEDGAEIVNVGSIAGLKATGSCIPYAASKAALHNLTVALARTLATDRIRVNAVAPGFITGRWLEEGLAERYERTKVAFEKAMPLGAVCTPNEVATAILSLLEGSDLVTGQILACDAGMSLAEPVQV
jgi:NAD(P)-dependent dehydrogenase (short-subunit alcohol dehydrogenase family)